MRIGRPGSDEQFRCGGSADDGRAHGITRSGIRQRCQELQVHDYMNKPVSERDFMRVVRDHKKLMVHTTPMITAAH